jgi:hypothetical protein
MVSQSLTGMTLLHPEQDEANSGFSVLQFGQIAISSGTGVLHA